MPEQSPAMRVQRRLDWLTRRWWLYPLILLVFFLPPYATQGYDPQASTDLIGATLAVYPAALMPQYAVRSGATLVIVNEGETELDHVAHLDKQLQGMGV